MFMKNQIIFYLFLGLIYGGSLSGCEVSDDFMVEDELNPSDPNAPLTPTLPAPNPSLMGGMLTPSPTPFPTGGMGEPNQCQAEGQRLGVCSMCDYTLTPVVPETETMCPFVDCDSLGTYATREVENGWTVCEYFPYDIGNPVCKGLGECNSNPSEVCTPQPTEILFTAYPGCASFTGCDGNAVPTALLKSPGDPCNGFGECQEDGQCSIAGGCATLDIVGSNEFCGVNDSNQCESLVVASSYQNIDKISCIAYCQRSRMECRNGWESNGGCSKGDEIGCSVDKREIICQCAP